MLTLGDVVSALGVEHGDLTQPIHETVVDSREVSPGAMFIALPGETSDGHDYVADAFQRGAAVAVIQQPLGEDLHVLDLRAKRPPVEAHEAAPPVALLVQDSLQALQTIAGYWRRQLDVRVIGITGSVGKSTTKELAADVLGQRFKTLKNPGNLNNEIGLPLTLLKLGAGHQRAVLEMGFYVPGEISLLCDLSLPHVGVVTNVSQVHMSRAGSMDAIVKGKSELVENLPPSPVGTAILNYDEPLVKEMANRTQADVFFYGLNQDADLWASDVEGLGLDGVRFVLHHGSGSLHVRVPLLGRHSVHTALRAAAVGLVEGLSWQEIIAGLQGTHTQLRLVAVNGPDGALLLDDTYNAAPTSTLAALNLLEELEGRRVAVLGDMLELGEFEERGHRLVGGRAAEIVDLLITVGERAHWIAQEARRAGLKPERIVELDNSEAALDYLNGRIGAGDVILIKGSHGMQMDQIVFHLEEPA
jgi:UDP-N-acetylmuramoyl-tripeptide--D-alanyl-D-alanine ligase